MPISDEHRDLLSRLAPMDLPSVPCEHCSPSVDGLTIEHSETCPVLLDIERVAARDSEWFEDHPYADFYYRPVIWAEGVQLLLFNAQEIPPGIRLAAAGRVRVERFATGVRGRRFDEVYFVAEDSR